MVNGSVSPLTGTVIANAGITGANVSGSKTQRRARNDRYYRAQIEEREAALASSSHPTSGVARGMSKVIRAYKSPRNASRSLPATRRTALSTRSQAVAPETQDPALLVRFWTVMFRYMVDSVLVDALALVISLFVRLALIFLVRFAILEQWQSKMGLDPPCED
jgi:hypothetical protein